MWKNNLKLLNLNIKNYKQFCCFDYPQEKSKLFKLGDVVINELNEVGVIIQIYKDSDVTTEFRTDMFGNACIYQKKYGGFVLASREQIKKYRQKLLKRPIPDTLKIFNN